MFSAGAPDGAARSVRNFLGAGLTVNVLDVCKTFFAIERTDMVIVIRWNWIDQFQLIPGFKQKNLFIVDRRPLSKVGVVLDGGVLCLCEGESG